MTTKRTKDQAGKLPISSPAELQRMAEANLRAEPAGRGTILLDDELLRLEILLEHIGGLCEAIQPHLRERYDYDADSGMQAFIEVIRERAKTAASLLTLAYGVFPVAVVEQREKNIKARAKAEREAAETDAKMERERAERSKKINAALDRIA